MTTAYISHPSSLLHRMGAGHPECPDRVASIERALIEKDIMPKLDPYLAPAATIDQLSRVHSPGYIDKIINESPAEGLVYLDPDTAMNPHSLQAAMHAAGAGILAVDLVMSGKAESAFCNIRPPGHHAGRNRAAGFCIFNNIAIAAAHALEFHGLHKVAIADFDVHHGNGTDHIFNSNPGVMLCSTFRHPYYPHEGIDTGNEHIINVPLQAGANGKDFRRAVSDRWLPALELFKPEFLLISAGFDAHREDYMGGLALSEEDYSWVTQILVELARTHCNGKVISMLEGGYALSALGRSAAAHVAVLAGLPPGSGIPVV